MSAFTALILLGLCSHALGVCEIDLDRRTGKHPPIYHKAGVFVYPEGDRLIKIANGDSLDVLCHGSEKKPAVLEGLGVSSATLDCSSSGQWSWSHEEALNVNSLSCDVSLEPIMTRTQDECADQGSNGRLDQLDKLTRVKIGWQLTASAFVTQIELCVDELTYATLWTSHEVLGRSIDFRDKDPGRPSFRRDVTDQARFFTQIDTAGEIVDAYTKKKQNTTVLDLLHYSTTASGEPFIETASSGTHYFAKGHLAPDAAFITNVEQDATYYFMNAAPQWQTFNNGNWKALENAVRNYAASLGENLSIWTGTFGQLAYGDSNDNSVNITLFNVNSTRWIPAPEYYWKVVYAPTTKKAIAFIGVNDPYTVEKPQGFPFCQDVCDGVSFASMNVSNQESGFLSCCSAEELRQAIPFLPDLSNLNGDVWPEVLQDVEKEQPLPAGTCAIDQTLLEHKEYPLYIQNDEFIYPEKEAVVGEEEHRFVYVAPGDELQVLCHGLDNASPLSLLGLPSGGDRSLETLTCQDGVFKVKATGEEVDIQQVLCSGRHWPKIRVTDGFPEGAPESVDGRTVSESALVHTEVGWEMPSGRFDRQINICQDSRSTVTLWTSHTIVGKAIEFRDKSVERPDFRKDEPGYNRMFKVFPTIKSLADSYTKKSEAAQMEEFLGSNVRADGHVWIEMEASGTHYLARGHLSPDAGFVYPAFQQATYFFINAAPQWQSFNNGNWKAMEHAVRAFGDRVKADLAVYTGTYGILSLEDTNGSKRRVYLYTEDNGKYISIPLYFWKVVHNRDANQAIVFVGVNNPYLSSAPSRKCTNVCDQLSWVTWNTTDIDAGYMYCCAVQDFRDFVEYLPDLAADNGGVWPDLLVDL